MTRKNQGVDPMEVENFIVHADIAIRLTRILLDRVSRQVPKELSGSEIIQSEFGKIEAIAAGIENTLEPLIAKMEKVISDDTPGDGKETRPQTRRLCPDCRQG